MEDQVRLMERVDLSALQGIYVTEDPQGYAGIRMWCGYCCTLLHVNRSHMGTQPFLSLMVKMADAHRQVECLNPQGPFVSSWSPYTSREWHQMRERAYAAEQESQEGDQEVSETAVASGYVVGVSP